MVASLKVKSLHTLLIVEDEDQLPDTLFVIKEKESKTVIHQYIRLNALPAEMREKVRQMVWRD